MTDSITAVQGLLDIDALLAPIPGDEAAGNERAYARGLRDQLIELRREEHADDFDDAMRPAELKRADWNGVVQLASETLISTTKDLRVVCHLIEAVTKLHGFVGLHEGLMLLRRLVEECWDNLNPRMDDGDVETRVAPLVNMLDDPHRGICLPLSVQTIPLIYSGRDSYGLIQWNRAKQLRDPKTEEALTNAVMHTPLADLEAVADAIDGCEEELHRLVPLLDERLGADSPGLTNLRNAIETCGQLVREGFLQGARSSRSQDEDVSASGDLHWSPETTSPFGVLSGTDQAILSRSDAYAQLQQAADTLEKLEPHSPIPHLVKRAVQLGRLPFPQLISTLIRDGNVLEELEREFGLRGTTDDNVKH